MMTTIRCPGAGPQRDHSNPDEVVTQACRTLLCDQDDVRTEKVRPWTPGSSGRLEEKVLAGSRLSFEDGVALYDTDEVAWLGELAHEVRTRKNGDKVFFNVNRHLNMTNVCSASCAYCSFQRKPGEKDAYTMRIEEAVRLAKDMEPDGITELHIVNGLHPTLPWRYYPKSISELKAVLPGVSIKAFTATEIHWFEKISGLAPTRSSTS